MLGLYKNLTLVMYSDDDLLPISALSHLMFCERRCALVHIEQLWKENLFTAQGRVMHDRVHEEKSEKRKDMRVEHGMSLRSLRLGLIGKADVIEFHRQSDGSWRPFPVEYKRGKPKQDLSDDVQLCAQAICLEEILNVSIPKGAIYYGKDHHRTEIEFTDALRTETEKAVRRLHELIKSGVTPKPVYEKKCESCSLVEVCLPKAIEQQKSVTKYLHDMVQES